MRRNGRLTWTQSRIGRRCIGFEVLTLTAALFLLFTVSCAPPASPAPGQEAATDEFDVTGDDVDQQITPGTIKTREPRECRALDSQLFDLSQADDPTALAERLGFIVRGDSVQVLLVLESDDTDFLEDFGAEPGTQVGSEVQAFVPFDQLCDLSQADPVLAIRPAAQAATE